VSNSETGAWLGEEAVPPNRTGVFELEETLVLLDRIAGLEAQLNQLSVSPAVSPTAQLSAEHQIIALQTSFAWRLGSALTDPRRVFRRIFRRSSRR